MLMHAGRLSSPSGQSLFEVRSTSRCFQQAQLQKRSEECTQSVAPPWRLPQTQADRGSRHLCRAATRPKYKGSVPEQPARAPQLLSPELDPNAAQPSTSGQPVNERESDSEVLIELKDVWKSFGDKHILQGANIKIRRGEAVGIIGGSGTGKSTTLRLMAGLITPDQGEVRIKGKLRHGLLADDPDIGKVLNVGMVFQNGALFDSLTVGENVGFLLYEHTDLSPDRVAVAVADSLASVGLSGVEKLMPSELSGGMRKRVALARAIVRDKHSKDADQVIMYDEPTAGLDPVASTVVEDLIRSLHVAGREATPVMRSSSSNGTKDAEQAPGGIAAYIVVTHQHSTIRRSVDRLIFLHEGRVVWEGPVDEFDNTADPFVRQFASGSLAGPIRYE